MKGTNELALIGLIGLGVFVFITYDEVKGNSVPGYTSSSNRRQRPSNVYTPLENGKPDSTFYTNNDWKAFGAKRETDYYLLNDPFW